MPNEDVVLVNHNLFNYKKTLQQLDAEIAAFKEWRIWQPRPAKPEGNLFVMGLERIKDYARFTAIFKSDDGGQTWNLAGDLELMPSVAPDHATILRVHRVDTQTVWTDERGGAAVQQIPTIELVTKTSDGSYYSLALFHAGTNVVRDDELLGKTLAEAQRVIESRGETIRGAKPLLPDL
jgi:hypothetical protein